MRWERLFADLEGQAEDAALEERDALVAELRDEEWAETSWRSLTGGLVDVDVLGAGRVSGRVALANDAVLHLVADSMDHVVSAGALAAVHATEHRADPPDRVASRIGWRQVLRQARDDGDDLHVVRRDGVVHEGRVDVVGADFVRLATTGDRRVAVPFGALALVSLRR